MDALPRRSPSVVRKVARAALRLDAELVGVVPAALMVVFVIIFVPVGFVVMLLSMAAMAGITLLAGLGDGPLGDVLIYIDLGVSIGLVFVLFVAIYRRLPRRLKEVATDPASLIPDDEAPPNPSVTAATATRPPAPAGSGDALSLAELDARLAPGRPHADDGRPGG